MLRKFVLLGIFTGGCASLPMLVELNPQAVERWYALIVADKPQSPEPTVAKEVTASPSPAPKAPGEPLAGRKVMVRSDSRGHFVAEFKLNGRATKAMVDTGATLVALNRSTARRIGIPLSNTDFKYDVQTANGTTKAASATIGRMQIGRISVEDIEALVLEDKALDSVLVGMSFLNRLSKFQVESGALVLQQ